PATPATEACRTARRRRNHAPRAVSARTRPSVPAPGAARATRGSRACRTRRCPPGSPAARVRSSCVILDVNVAIVFQDQSRRRPRDSPLHSYACGSVRTFRSLDLRRERNGQRQPERADSHRRTHLFVAERAQIGGEPETEFEESEPFLEKSCGRF